MNLFLSFIFKKLKIVTIGENIEDDRVVREDFIVGKEVIHVMEAQHLNGFHNHGL